MNKKAKHFRIIGLRPTQPKDPFVRDEEYMRHVDGIHKALSHHDEWFYIFHGVEVMSDYSSITFVDKDTDRDFSFYDTENIKISVSAIVGKNGTGKSSFVELIVRVINNLSAVLLGEKLNFATAEHLHYIDYLYADLLVQIENKLYIISVAGRAMEVIVFTKQKSDRFTYERNEELSMKILSRPDNETSRNELLKGYLRGRSLLRKLFYTMVCNYSLYGFNYRDFDNEATPEARLNKLYRNSGSSHIYEDEEKIWLNGIFHKNDGYQTPIVLHPFRHNGQLDISKENQLAKERLLSLIFYKDSRGEYPMRIINDNLSVIALRITLNENKKYSKDNMLNTLRIGKNRNANIYFDSIYDTIVEFWDSKFGICAYPDRLYFEEARDYIVYKTLKIVNNYKKYYSIFRYLSLKDFDRNILRSRLNALLEDHTHITRKLYQAINYIIDPIFNPEDSQTDVKMIDNALAARGEADKASEALRRLPPPIFKTDIILKRVAGNVADDLIIDDVPFSGLSSGERQIVYTISNIVYHLTNVDSEWDDSFDESMKLYMIRYKYMNIILDEVELYFHPDMQRIFVSSLIHTLQCIRFSKIKGINLIFVTHSPFILSDVQSNNVLALGDAMWLPNDFPKVKTFGANIMDMLANTFFMESAIGECVRSEISSLVELHIEIFRNGNKSMIDKYIKLRPRFRQLSKMLADNFWTNTTKRMIEQLDGIVKKETEEIIKR